MVPVELRTPCDIRPDWPITCSGGDGLLQMECVFLPRPRTAQRVAVGAGGGRGNGASASATWPDHQGAVGGGAKEFAGAGNAVGDVGGRHTVLRRSKTGCDPRVNSGPQ